MSKNIQNYCFQVACYYAVWFSCIFSVTKCEYLLISLSCIIILMQLIWQYLYMKMTKGLLLFIVFLLIFSIFIEVILIKFELIQYNGFSLLESLPPIWLILLWLEFGILLFSCFRGYFHYFTTLVILSFIGFMIAYYVGQSLGAANIPNLWTNMTLVSVLWAFFLPSFLFFYTKMLSGL